MNQIQIDHLVVAASSLDAGEDYIHRVLGVKMQAGGKHVELGTHNKVLRLGERCYLEVIAVDPEAGELKRPRWFELDSREMRERLNERPQLITWAVRTSEIETLAAKSSVPLGAVKPMSRSNLRWRLTMTDDGCLPAGGLIPFLIEWAAAPHPTASMKDSGCSLIGLQGVHPEPEKVESALESLGARHLISIEKSSPASIPSLLATIETPTGIKTLS